MAEFKNMTVRALRGLARKALGRGHSKLKTKQDLIAALEAAQRKVAGAAEKAAHKVREATGQAPRTPAKAGEPEKTAVPAPTPDPEAHRVARVAGEEAARVALRPMTESAAEAERGSRQPPGDTPTFREGDERLGDLAQSYSDDTLMVLPRDPATLFLHWDLAQDTVRRASEGLDDGRAQVWLFVRENDGSWTRLRTLEIALESRSHYVHDLPPGRVYRAEIHVVDRAGKENLLPARSNEMMLPPIGPSPIVDDRFMRVLWSEPLQRLLCTTHPGAPFPDDAREQLFRLSDWSRFGGCARGLSGAGGGVGRPSSPSGPLAPRWPWADGEGR